MDLPIVSIIIPVYNESARIEKCINSFQKQILKNIEIIAVNDGSTDNSYDIIKRLTLSDARIRLLDFPNGGTAVALNRGLQNAKGKYIGFSGADDWAEAEMFEKMARRIEEDETDLVICNIQKEWDDRIQNTIQIDKEDIIDDNLLEKYIRFDFDYSICNKLYKREHIERYKIDFQHDLRIGQDVLFNLLVFSVINKVSVMPYSFYHYVAKPHSLMASPPQSRIHSFNEIIKGFKEFCSTWRFTQQWEIFKNTIGYAYQSYFFNLVLKSEYSSKFNFLKYYKYLVSSLKMLDPLLLPPPHLSQSGVQRIKKNLLHKKRFKTFAFLAGIRHKLVK